MTGAVDEQLRALTEIIGVLADGLSRLSARVDAMAAGGQAGAGDPAAWVLSSPLPHPDPQMVVPDFVAFYNVTYVGEGSRATPIPNCWQRHPGLAMEVATLAHTWREANLGPTSNVRDAQQWHHQWRPAFVDRIAREWVGGGCLDGSHREPS